jgi:phage tail sheath protein FI
VIKYVTKSITRYIRKEAIMSRYTYPGVYVEEIPSGVHTIAGVSTAAAAFIGFFREGPMNKAVKIYGMGDFNRVFGGLDIRSQASYSISQFFENGGSEAWVIRVAADPTAHPLTKAAVILKSGSTSVLEVWAINEGVWGNNLRVDINHNTTDAEHRFNFIVTRYDGPNDDAKPLISESFLNLSMDETDSRYAVEVINEASNLVEVKRKDANTSNIIPAATGLLSGDLHGFSGFSGLQGKKFKITIGGVEKIATFDTDLSAVTSLTDLRKYIEKAIRNADTNTFSPCFSGAVVELVSKTSGTTTTEHFRILAGRKGELYNAVELLAISNFSSSDTTANALKLITSGSSANVAANNVQEYKLGLTGTPTEIGSLKKNGTGADGLEPGAAEIIGQNGTEPFTGMYALDNVDIFNILCIPRTADLADAEMDAVVSKAITYCEEKRAFYIIDIPEDVDKVEKMTDWIAAKANYRHKNTAVYFPRLNIPDPLNEYRLQSRGASGTVAGIYSKIDGTRNVWKAPAGTEVVLRGVSSLDADITDAQNGTLNPLAVNCFRNFPVYGMICWGARTLDGSDQAGSEWKYIPVRRLALFLEESLFRGTKWVVFEPNDEPLWANIRMNIRAFMMNLFRQGAFQGGTPQEAFYVKCDGETTTQNDRNSGVVNIEVGFAPLKPAEFVVIKFQQITGKL